MTPAHDPQKATRQCWECVKRRLVCDHTLPHCKKCIKRGKDCPGYDAQKPLQWVKPGKITSRKRTKGSKKSGLNLLPSMLPIREPDSSTSVSFGSGDGDDESEQSEEERRNMYQQAALEVRCAEDADRILQFGNKHEIEEIISKRLRDEAAKMMNLEKDPLKGLRYVLRYMRKEQLPNYDFQNDTYEAVQAIKYFNTRIIPECTGSEWALVHNPMINFFPLAALHLLSPAVHSSFICITLQHYIRKLPPGASEQAETALAPKIWQHRGDTIRELSQRVADKKTQTSLATLTSVVVFLTNEIQAQTLPQWRSHIDVLMQIMELRGGLMKMYRSAYYLHGTVVLFHMVVTSSNCTSPAHYQVVLAPTLNEELENVEEIYHELFPYCLCPPPIFFYMIRINHLRREASIKLIQDDDLTDLSILAADLLSQIEAFSVDDWAQPGADFDDWVTIGSAWHHAMAVFCIMSLESLALFPNTPQMRARLERHSVLLVSYLKKVMLVNRLRRFANWPLVVAGVEAGYRGEGRRKWVEDCCDNMARSSGAYGPLNLKVILKRYWNSGSYGWEECFQQPCAFLF